MIFILFLCIFCINSQEIQQKSLNIHIIPHSHVDPMWKALPHEYLKTTNKILEGVILSLIHSPNRTFVWESIYFLDNFLTNYGSMSVCDIYSQRDQELLKEWCKSYSNIHQDHHHIFSRKCCTMKQALAHLISTGQFELVGGGWVSHDETLTDYQSKLDNYMIGRRWIAKELGIQYVPSISWNIDSFGHTTGNSGIILGLNYSFQVLNRIPYRIKSYLQHHGPLTFHYLPERLSHPFQLYNGGGGGGDWKEMRQSAHSIPREPLLLTTAILPFHYSSPGSIDHSLHLPHLSRSRLESVAFSFLTTVTTLTNTDCDSVEGDCNVMILLGNDQTYAGYATTAYGHIDSLIRFINELYSSSSIGSKSLPSSPSLRGIIDRSRYRLKVMYSTPSRYFDSKKHSAASLASDIMEHTTGKGHFAPYSDSFLNDWTGYYGSRPLLKEKIRYFESILHQLETFVIGLLLSSSSPNEHNLKHIYSTFTSFYQRYVFSTHHDTITGTSQRSVIEKYQLRLDEDISKLFEYVNGVLVNVLKKETQLSSTSGDIDVYVLDKQNGISIIEQENRAVISYFIDWDLSNHVSHPLELTLRSTSSSTFNKMCLHPTNFPTPNSWQLLHNFDVIDELYCDPHRPCPSHFSKKGTGILDVSKVNVKNLLRLSNQSNTNETAGQRKDHLVPNALRILVSPTQRPQEGIQSLTFQNCERDDPAEKKIQTLFQSAHSQNQEIETNARQVLESLIPYLVRSLSRIVSRFLISSLLPVQSIRTLTSGVGWHSSGAYLMRTPFNALLTGIVHFTIGFSTSFCCLLFYLSFPQVFDGLYRKISQTLLSSSFIKNTFYGSKHDSPTRRSTSTWRSSCSWNIFDSCCNSICSICKRITPLLLCWMAIKMTLTALMFIWIYLQTPTLWSYPVIPFHSIASLYSHSLYSVPYWVGFSLCIWIASVVSVVLYSTTAATQISYRNHSVIPRNPHVVGKDVVSRLLTCFHSLCSGLSPYMTMLLFIWIVYTSILLASLVSFFLSPEFQSFSSSCLDSSSPRNLHGQNISLSETAYQSGPMVSEFTYLPCPGNPSIVIAVRKYHPMKTKAYSSSSESLTQLSNKESDVTEEEFEIEILSRVTPGTDLLLRIDLGYWEDKFLTSRMDKSNYDADKEEDKLIQYEGVSSDGWWGMIRKYEWLTPLSANFLPVSNRFFLTGYSSPYTPSDAIHTVLDSLFPSFLLSSPVTDSTLSSRSHRDAFHLSFTPLYPAGLVQYSNKVEWLIHRSHLVDDEKGLEEGLLDTNRGRSVLHINYKESRDKDRATRSHSQQYSSGDSHTSTGIMSPLVVVSNHKHHHQYLEPRLKSAVQSLRMLQENSILAVSQYLSAVPLLPSPSQIKVTKITLISGSVLVAPLLSPVHNSSLSHSSPCCSTTDHELCILIGSTTLSSPSQFIPLNVSHSTPTISLCTLDCLFCPWDKAVSYFLEQGMLAIKTNLSSSS